MNKLGQKIWKGRRVMEMNVDHMEGRMVVLWNPITIELYEWWANHFSLMSEFKILGSVIAGTLVNVYGPSTFPQKQAFLRLLH